MARQHTGTPVLYNREAERAVLGACLLGRLDIVTRTRNALPNDPFYIPRHAMIWRALCTLADEGIAADPLTVTVRLKETGERWDPDIGIYLNDLYSAAPMVANPAHATEVAHWARIRRIWEAGTRIVQQAAAVADVGADVDHSLERLIAQVQTEMGAIGHAAGDDQPHSWQPVDIEAILDGTWTSPEPTVGKRSDGRFFLYPGRVHTAAGESESGKTWFAAALALAELNAGNGVIHLDFEDDEVGVVSRYMAVGATRDQLRNQFAYIHPYDPLTDAIARTDLDAALTRLHPTLVTVDGVTEAMNLHDLDPLSNVDAAKFGAILLRWIAGRGPAVLALDHVTKSRDDRGRYALGAVHKLNAVNGAAFIIDNRRAFGIGITGRSMVLISKDRPAQLRQHAQPATGAMHWYADLIVNSHDATFVELELKAPPASPEDFRPTLLMAKISEAMRRAGQPLSENDIVTRVGGKRAIVVRQALAFLVDDGNVTVERGPYRSKLHTLVRPFEPEGVQMELPEQERLEGDRDGSIDGDGPAGPPHLHIVKPPEEEP